MKSRFPSLVFGLCFGLLCDTAAHSQDTEAAPLVSAPKIVDALNPKDIVLDRNGNLVRPRRDPSISLRVQFGFGSADLTPYGQRQLDQLAQALGDPGLAGAAFELAGHTDRVGDNESNLRLSVDRANAVKAYLVGTHGIASERLQTIGFGYTQLADARQPTAGVNRRVEVRRLLTRGLPGDRPLPAPFPAGEPGGRLVPTPR